MIKRGTIFVRDPRGCDVARKATWQRHAVPKRHIFISIFYIFYIVSSAFHRSEGNINPFESLRLLNSIDCFNFSHVGLSPTQFI